MVSTAVTVPNLHTVHVTPQRMHRGRRYRELHHANFTSPGAPRRSAAGISSPFVPLQVRFFHPSASLTLQIAAPNEQQGSNDASTEAPGFKSVTYARK